MTHIKFVPRYSSASNTDEELNGPSGNNLLPNNEKSNKPEIEKVQQVSERVNFTQSSYLGKARPFHF